MAETGSVLANAAARRATLNKVRSGLLDRPGIARQGGPPPPTAPAQDRESPQEKSLEGARATPLKGVQEEGQPPESGVPPEQVINPLGLDEEAQQELMSRIEPFLEQMKKEKRAKLHRRIGRTRKFFGGGV